MTFTMTNLLSTFYAYANQTPHSSGRSKIFLRGWSCWGWSQLLQQLKEIPLELINQNTLSAGTKQFHINLMGFHSGAWAGIKKTSTMCSSHSHFSSTELPFPVWFAALSRISTSPTSRNWFAMADSISSENRLASTVASVIRYLTGVELVQIPHMPIIEYVLHRSRSIVVAGTSPVRTSLRASLLKIDLPFDVSHLEMYPTNVLLACLTKVRH